MPPAAPSADIVITMRINTIGTKLKNITIDRLIVLMMMVAVVMVMMMISVRTTIMMINIFVRLRLGL